MARDRPPRLAIMATLAVVAVMAWSTRTSAEAWPLGPWELFSRVRLPVQVSYVAKSVDSEVEEQIDFGGLPPQFAGAHALLGEFTRLSPVEQEALCSTWAAALRQSGGDPEEIRVYRLERRLRLDGGPPRRREQMVHECRI